MYVYNYDVNLLHGVMLHPVAFGEYKSPASDIYCYSTPTLDVTIKFNLKLFTLGS